MARVERTVILENSYRKPKAKPLNITTSSVLIIVGSGPVGVQFAQELIQRGFKGIIKLFGDEPWRPYNRVQLSALLAGEIRYGDIVYPEISTDKEHYHFFNRRVTEIHALKHSLIDSNGVRHQYDALVLATGSTPWIPKLDKVDLKGVFVFRDLDDAQQLMARSVRTRHTVVIGGGLLGVEAARAMQRNHTQVTLLHQSNRLMNRQLDVEAGAILKRSLEGYGIEVKLNAGVSALLGEDVVTGVELRNGQVLTCDTVIFATGIQPNVAMARSSGIKVGRGIRINNHLQTNLPDIFAIGECAEHDDQIYGLLAPGHEQAAVLADRLCGGNAHYKGSKATTSLKVLDLPVFTLGWIGDEYEHRIDETLIFHCESGAYRKLFLQRNRLRGVVAIGECEEKNRLHQVVTSQQRILPWQKKRFKKDGRLWPVGKVRHVRDWPASAKLCSCRNVSVGKLLYAQRAGCSTADSLAACTGAGTVCGTCAPLLQELCSFPHQQPAWQVALKPLLAVMAVAMAVLSIALV
ncbi:NAD(P)/FAD-dependent oxidoreductase [Ketobacter sp. MCCC 1A13808]|uniref:FAD-dependent oxidoreductase n=1 Tax=Ketobacter sp. MCCC 1A13808 TaxID=2602738 RepID=UPI000F2A056A|nr:FAD-dependent oxidoreductase [Ketobacter sp. MCCC 1A13808]MVF10668.1 NAD(P)/FAD-dependent oxidoreductase [Ketobacter sp. MCCC 1A13808]RLP56088.1 MAG: NAD(P)/FAD-dependent oxidoreductase [Ketobacter sp.]